MSENSKEEKIAYTVPPAGSLGLLALGDVGLKAWREAREKAGWSKDQLFEKMEEIEAKDKSAEEGKK